MTDLERFLRLATWSLWGAQKRTVRLELESHIAHKTWKYQVRGFSETEALQKALIDLGQPHVISAGMTGVYTMPTLFRNTVLVGLLLSLGITTFQSSAQVSGTNRIPIQPCLESTNITTQVKEQKIQCEDQTNTDFFLNIADLKTDLIAKGVEFEQEERTYADGKKEYVPKLTFPGGKPITLIQGGSRGYGNSRFEYSKEFINADVFLIENLPASGLPVTLSGWDKPVVRVGETQFDISFSSKMSKPESLYGSIVFRIMFKWIIDKLGKKQNYSYGVSLLEGFDTRFFPSEGIYQKRFRTEANPDQAYAVLYLEKGSNFTSLQSRVFHMGNNKFALTDQLKNLEFVDSWDKLKPIALGGINPQRSGTAILARVNTVLNDPKQILEIVNPNEIRVLGIAERVIAKATTQSSFCKDKGGANTTLSGRWIGELQSFDVKGQKVTGKLNNKIQPNGVYEGWFESRQAKSSGMTLGAFCNDNQFTGSLEYEAPRFAVNTSTGSIKQISSTLIEGSSIERDEANNIISRTYFRLRKQ
jgi:hypothetical protein